MFHVKQFELTLKTHLLLDDYVAMRFKMLTRNRLSRLARKPVGRFFLNDRIPYLTGKPANRKRANRMFDLKQL